MRTVCAGKIHGVLKLRPGSFKIQTDQVDSLINHSFHLKIYDYSILKY